MEVNVSARVARARERYNVGLLVPVAALVVAELWYLTTQARSVIMPAFWMVPMATLLVLYALDSSLELATVTAVLFSGRLLLLPYLVLVPMDSYFMFYALFMAPADVLLLLYAFQTNVDGSARSTGAA